MPDHSNENNSGTRRRSRSRSVERGDHSRSDRRGEEDSRRRNDHHEDRSRSGRRDERERERDDGSHSKGKHVEDRRRSRSRSRSPARNQRRSRSRSRSRSPSRDRSRHSGHRSHRRSRSKSPSDSSSGSDSEDSRDRRHRRKKEKRAKEKLGGGLDSKGRDREERRQRKKDKKEKKEKKERKKKGLAVVEWGKHGILNENDIYTKDQEFRAWLVEERTLNPETLPKNKMKEEFKSFMEEYNTATFNSDKFYDIAKFEARMNAVRMGETVATSDTYDANADMEAVRNSHRRVVQETDTFLDRSRLEGLRQLQNERTQLVNMKRLGMEVKDSLGVRTEGKVEAGMRK